MRRQCHLWWLARIESSLKWHRPRLFHSGWCHCKTLASLTTGGQKRAQCKSDAGAVSEGQTQIALSSIKYRLTPEGVSVLMQTPKEQSANQTCCWGDLGVEHSIHIPNLSSPSCQLCLLSPSPRWWRSCCLSSFFSWTSAASPPPRWWPPPARWHPRHLWAWWGSKMPGCQGGWSWETESQGRHFTVMLITIYSLTWRNHLLLFRLKGTE